MRLVSVLIISNLLVGVSACAPVITNGLGGGLGDSLANYCLARVLALKYKVDFRLIPFDECEKFNFYETTKQYTGSLVHRVALNNEAELLRLVSSDTIFHSHCFTDCGEVSAEIAQIIKHECNLKTEFIAQPELLSLEKLNIALHIRTGLGAEHYDGELYSQQLFDFDRTQVRYHSWQALPFVHLTNLWFNPFKPRIIYADVTFNSLRFPPLQFYIDQLALICRLLPEAQLFVQIFTDHPDPQSLLLTLRNYFSKPQIIFHWQDYYNKNAVINDLYAMSRFDVLIRSYSYFARAAELIGNHKVVIFPLKYIWDENKLIITDIGIKGKI